MNDMIRFACHHCSKPLKANRATAGRSGICLCGAKFVIPSAVSDTLVLEPVEESADRPKSQPMISGFALIVSCLILVGGVVFSVVMLRPVAVEKPVTVIASRSEPTSHPATLLANERVELERQRAEIERQRREALEAQIREKQAMERTHDYTPQEFQAMKEQMGQIADTLGQLLLNGTHPTGTYRYTSSPLVNLSSDQREITVSVSVNWKGGLTDNVYQTTYSFGLTKKEGVGTLKVIRDTAIFQIDPQFLRNTEYALKEYFRSSR